MEKVQTGPGEKDPTESGPTYSGPMDPGLQISMDKQIATMRQQYIFLLENQRREMEVAVKRMQETRQGHKGEEAKCFQVEGSQNNLRNIVDPNNVSSLLRRELKIYSQLGNKVKMTSSVLCHYHDR